MSEPWLNISIVHNFIFIICLTTSNFMFRKLCNPATKINLPRCYKLAGHFINIPLEPNVL